MAAPSFWNLLGWDEALVVHLSIASSTGALITIALAAIALTWTSGEAIGVLSLGVLTEIMCLVMWRKWATRVNSRKTMLPTSLHIYTNRFLAIDCLFALGWIIVSVIVTVSISEGQLSQSYSRFILDPRLLWVQSLLAWLMSGLLWTMFLSGVYSRHQSAKRSQSSQTPEPQNKILLEPHTKWMLGLILVLMAISIIEFNLSLGDGRYGGYSAWLLLVAAGLTFFLHFITLYVWRKTGKKRRGTTTPPFIYSITLAVLTALLAPFWLAAAVVTIVFRKSNVKYYNYTIYHSDSYSTARHAGYFDMLERVRWAAGVLACVVAILMSVQSWLVLYYRRRFLKRVSLARDISQSTAGTNMAVVNNNGNPTNAAAHPINVTSYSAQYPLPVAPESVYNPQFVAQQQQQQQQAIYTANAVPSSPVAHSPTLH
ncbi:hypothetical protein FRB91_000436, partial [Serendipita sp. 411]